MNEVLSIIIYLFEICRDKDLQQKIDIISFNPFPFLMISDFLFIRISQDLAKDLAMLAREIHDVAGEIDSVSPAATDPGALVKLLEEIIII